MKAQAAVAILEALAAVFQPCRACPRRCGARRVDGEAGACGAGRHAALFMEYVHWAEDADIVPAHALHVTGCNLGCTFCQTREEQQRLASTVVTTESLQQLLHKGRQAGARTVDILGGEPTVNAYSLVELFSRSGDFPGLVWNTNLYAEAETFLLLDQVVDIYLGDIKFAAPRCAEALCGVKDAAETAMARAKEIYARKPLGLIVRHLVIPGHFSCCTRPILEWIAHALPGVRVSLRTGYLPPGDMAAVAERRFLRAQECAAALDLAQALGLNLTRDAILPGVGQDGAMEAGGVADFEVVVAPGGEVYVRHVTLAAARLLAAIDPEGQGESG